MEVGLCNLHSPKYYSLPLSLSSKCLLTKHIRGLNISSREGEVLHDSLLKQLTRKQVSDDLKATSQFFCWQHRLMHIPKSPTSPMFVKFPAFFPRSRVTSSVVFPAMHTGARCLRCFFPVSRRKRRNFSRGHFAITIRKISTSSSLTLKKSIYPHEIIIFMTRLLVKIARYWPNSFILGFNGRGQVEVINNAKKNEANF